MGCSRTAFAIFALLFIVINGSSVVVVVAKIAIFSGQSLTSGQYLESGPYRFIMQTDCNLVLYVNLSGAARALWDSKTNGKGTLCSANLLTTGNLVVLDGSGVKLFDSGTTGSASNYVLVVQGDGNVVTYPSAIWSTNTVQS